MINMELATVMKQSGMLRNINYLKWMLFEEEI